MRDAESVLTELVSHVRPPRGCKIEIMELAPNGPKEPNWVAACGIADAQTLRTYTDKVAELRNTDQQIDWSKVPLSLGAERRRVVLSFSDVEDR